MEHPINPDCPAGLAPPGGHYSHSAGHGDLVFISGQLSSRANGTQAADLPFDDQVRQALANLRAALVASGSDLDSIVKVTAYIVDVAYWPQFNSVYAEVMGASRPARTVVPVPELHNGYLVEVEAIAVRIRPVAAAAPP